MLQLACEDASGSYAPIEEALNFGDCCVGNEKVSPA
jgi:hypothetical protein